MGPDELTTAFDSSLVASPALLSEAGAVSSTAAPMAELAPGPSSYDLPSSVILFYMFFNNYFFSKFERLIL